MKAKLARWWLPALVLLAIVWQYRAPLLGRVYFFEDIAAYFQPLWTAAARQMRRGALPSWDLGAWSGLPMLGDPQAGVLYPLDWLWLLVKPIRLYAWLQLMHALVGAAGMWALCRARGRSREAAALASLSLALGAFFVLETRHQMFVASTAWLPWLLWAIEKYADDRRLERIIVLAGATGLVLLAGGWSMLLFGSVVVVVVALARVVEAAPSTRLTLFAAYAAAGLLGLGLAGAQLGPALVHAHWSPRALGVDSSFAASYAWPSWKYLVTLLFPTFYGDDARGTYTGAPDQWELCGYAIGFVSTVLVPFSLLERKRRGERIVLLVAVLVACDLARGMGGLLHPLLFRLVPVYASLRCPARALFIWTVAAPFLAADGLDALVARLPARLDRRLIAGALVVALAGELVVTWRAENPSTSYDSTVDRPQAAKFLLAHPGMRMTTDVHLGQRFHNAGLTWGLESAVGYSSLPIWRYLHFLWIANHGRVYPHAKLADDLTAQGLWTFDSPLVDLLSVGWVLAPHDRPITARKFHRVLTGSDGIDLWQNDGALPRAFVVYRTRVARDGDQAAQLIASRAFEPSRTAIVEQPVPSVPVDNDGEAAPPANSVDMLLRTGPDELAVEVNATAPGVLVLSAPYYPGWTAAVDGKPAELLRVDYALSGVALSPGRHEIAFTWFDDALAWGGGVSVVALLTLAGLALVARSRRRAS